MKNILSVLAVAALLAACGPPPDTIYDDGDQKNSTCDDAPFHDGPGVQGDFCSSAKFDCEVHCCQCPNDGANGGDNSFLVSECFRGYCTSGSQACSDACDERGEN